MDYVRPVDFSKFHPDNFHSQVLGDQSSGVHSAKLMCTRVPPGKGSPSIHVHTGDQFYYILKGEMNVHLGEFQLTAGAGDLVFLPQAVPHSNWNSTDEEEIHFELIAPDVPPHLARTYRIGDPDPTLQLKPLDDGNYVRHIDTSSFRPDAFTSIPMADRTTGSKHCRINLVQVPPGKSGPALHVHTSDQYYYVVSGTMQLQIGRERFTARPNTYVVLPAGITHANWNEGPEPERHIAVLVPEQEPGSRSQIPVQLEIDR